MRALRPASGLCVALLLAVSALVLTAAPDALACAVCAGKDDAKVSLAMLKGTALLSLLPLAFFAVGAWYLRRRARQLATLAATAARGETQAPTVPAARPS